MPDMEDRSQTPRKRRIIHWNPEDEEAAERARSSRKRLITLCVAAGIVAIAVVSLIALWENPNQDAKALATRLGVIDEALPKQDFREAFASRSKADLEMASADSGLGKIRQMRVNHPILTTKLVSVEREFIQAENLMARTAYVRAYEAFIKVNSDIEDFSRLVDAKISTQDMYDNFLIRVDELKQSKHLNPEAYDQAFDAASAGKQFLMEGSFTASETKLRVATDKLQELADSIDQYIRTNSALGHRYIAQGKGAEAVEAFSNVLSINPENEDALLQLERAKNADEVFALIGQSETQERSSAFEDALSGFQQAFEKDPKSAKAQNGVSRVRRKIENRDFGNYLAIARKAEEESRYDEAIEHFRLALTVFPDRKDLSDAIAKATEDKRQSDIANLITRAYAFENDDRAWESARAIYLKLIKMEPDLQAAKDGLLRTGKVIRSILRYEKYLEMSAIDAERRRYLPARQSWDKAMQSKPDYLELSEDAKRLQQHLITQSRPVAVLFISDMSTWVSIQGPTGKKPTKLKESTINLMPGDYRVKGQKKGYQDISYRLQIKGGVAQSPLTVICNQKR